MDKLEDAVVKATVEVGKEFAEDLVKPTAQSIGNNVGVFVDGVMGWLGYWGEKQKIKRKVYLQKYKEDITKNIFDIPEEKLVDPAANIIGPAIEASKYHIEEPTCREMFAKLIASACNSELVSDTHPSFPDIVRQLSPIDARFLSIFKEELYYPSVHIKEIHPDNIVTPYPYMLFDLGKMSSKFSRSDELNLSSTVELLVRLGLLIKNDEVIALNYDYEKFRNHWLYKAMEKGFEDKSKVVFHRYRLELSLTGQNFLKCCIPDKL